MQWSSLNTPTSMCAMQFPTSRSSSAKAGWPSEGRTKRFAEPSLANEAYFVRGFVQLAMEKGWDYYLMEAYDQPWKGGMGE